MSTKTGPGLIKRTAHSAFRLNSQNPDYNGESKVESRRHMPSPTQDRPARLVSVPAGEDFIAAEKAAATKQERSDATKAVLWGAGVAVATVVVVSTVAGGVNRIWDNYIGNDQVPTDAVPAVVAGPPQDGSVEVSPDHPPVSVAFGEGGTIIEAADHLAVPGQEGAAVQALLRANGGSELVQPDQVAVLDQDTGEARIVTPGQPG